MQNYLLQKSAHEALKGIPSVAGQNSFVQVFPKKIDLFEDHLPQGLSEALRVWKDF